MPNYLQIILNHRSAQLLLLLVICAGAFFPHLGERPADLMEARNFVTAREIVQNHTWLIPTLNGIPRIAKPPLPTWITAATYIMGGRVDNNGLLRIPAAMMGIVLIFALWGLVRCLSANDHLALVTGTVAATSLLIMDMSRCGSWDIYCHSFMLLAILALVGGWRKERPAYPTFLLAGVCMACAFLSKGPVPFFALLLPFCIAYVATYGTRGVIRQIKPLILALCLTIFISSLWPVLIYLKMPQLSSSVATTEAASWLVRHRRPFFFYAHFPIYTGVWAIVVAAAIFFPFARNRIRQVGNYRFIILWALISLLLLSIIPEKKERYLLPAMIPLSLLGGHLIYGIMTAWAEESLLKTDLRLLCVQTCIVVVACAAAPVILFLFGVKNSLLSLPVAVIWSILFCVTAGACMYACIRKSAPGILGSGVILVLLVNLALLPAVFQMLEQSYKPEMVTLEKSRRTKAIQNLPFFSLTPLNPKLIWKVGKVVKTWDVAETPDPTGGEPLVLLTLEGGANIFPPKMKRRLSLTPMGKYHYDPKNSQKYVHLVLVEFVK